MHNVFNSNLRFFLFEFLPRFQISLQFSQQPSRPFFILSWYSSLGFRSDINYIMFKEFILWSFFLTFHVCIYIYIYITVTFYWINFFLTTCRKESAEVEKYEKEPSLCLCVCVYMLLGMSINCLAYQG